MYPATKCFLLTCTDRVDRRLRRYSRGEAKCLVNGHYHDAEAPLDVAPAAGQSGGEGLWPKDDPRWPTRCGCGYEFAPANVYQLFVEHLWRRVDTGEEYRLRDAPPGAMYDADWLHDLPGYLGPDGRSLMVKLPNGRTWHIDGRASNCSLPGDNAHKCWVRHGEPPRLTVDKAGITCAAGAGSILAADYHGFLQNGILTAG